MNNPLSITDTLTEATHLRTRRVCLLLLALILGACADQTSDATADAKADGTTTPSSSPEANDHSLGALVERAPLQNQALVTIRGAMRWKEPLGWTEKDTSGKPFVAAEYFLPSHSEATPSMCRIRNGSAPKSDADVEKTANKRVGDVRVKTPEGKSLRSKVARERVDLGQFSWAVGTADGAWYDDGTMINPRDPPFIVEDYIGMAAAPIIGGPPFVINCWGPSETISAQRSTINAWLASIEVDPIAQTP